LKRNEIPRPVIAPARCVAWHGPKLDAVQPVGWLSAVKVCAARPKRRWNCGRRTNNAKATERPQLARAGWSKGSLSFVEKFLLSDSEIKDPTTPYIVGDEFVDYTLPDAAVGH